MWACILYVNFLGSLRVFAEGDEGQTGILRGVALIIGQSKYKHLTELPNPVNDADKLDKLLTQLGFETTTVEDRKLRRLKRDIEYLVEDSAEADVALLYYSGHGIEVAGVNYLIPVDVKVSNAAVNARKLINLNEVLERLSRRAKVVIILLDACRDNPFPEGTQIRGSAAIEVEGDQAKGQEEERGEVAESVLLHRGGGLGVMRGMKRIQTDSHQPHDLLGEVIGYAAAPGHVALDGPVGGSSPYASALVKHLAAPNLEFGQVMTLVAEEVYLSTKGKQRPWVNASLRRLLYFGGAVKRTSEENSLIEGERRQLLLTLSTVPPMMRRTIEGVASVNGLPMDALFAMLKQLEIDPEGGSEALAEQLKKGAKRLKKMMKERASLSATDPEIKRLLKLADRALAEGALDAASRFYRRAKKRVKVLEGTVSDAEEQVRRRRLEFAGVFAGSARTNELASDWRGAAQDWGQAAEQVKLWDAELYFDYRDSQVNALMDAGEHQMDQEALDEAVEMLKELGQEVTQDKDPIRWRRHQKLRALVGLIQGELEGDPEAIEQAVNRLRSALSSYEKGDRKRILDQREKRGSTQRVNQILGDEISAHTHAGTGAGETEGLEKETEIESQRAVQPMNEEALFLTFDLAGAYFKLGELKGSVTPLTEAVTLYEKMISQGDQSLDLVTWATVQNNLGLALLRLGERVSEPLPLRRAKDAFQAALSVYTQSDYPMDWSIAHNNLGLALLRLGERVADRSILREAAASFERSLEERVRERLPMEWAMTQSNLCLAQYTLGEREAGVETLKQAVVACRAALEEYTEERAPHFWATTQNNLSMTLHILGARTRGVEVLEEALRVSRSIQRVYARESLPIGWAIIQNGIGNILNSLGERLSGYTRLDQAVEAFDAAMSVFNQEDSPIQWAILQNNRALPLRERGRRALDLQALTEARASLDRALSVRSEAELPLEWSMSLTNRAEVLLFISSLTGGVELIEEVIQHLQSALTVRTREEVPLDWATTTTLLARAHLRRAHSESAQPDDLERAEALIREALEENIRSRAPLEWAKSQRVLGQVLMARGEAKASRLVLVEALEEVKPDQSRFEWLETQLILAQADLRALGYPMQMDHETHIRSVIETMKTVIEQLDPQIEATEMKRAKLALIEVLLEGSALNHRLAWRDEASQLLDELAGSGELIAFNREALRCRLGQIDAEQNSLRIAPFPLRHERWLAELQSYRLELRAALQSCMDGLHHPLSTMNQDQRKQIENRRWALQSVSWLEDLQEWSLSTY